ncbi:MAG: IS5 family transposase, partial [Rhabdochlamydiaceae bacterium]
MSQYKVRNWSQYNESLKKRGSLSLWISEDAIEKWRSPKDPHWIGAPQQYSDDAILCIMTLKVVYHLPYRQLIGFVFSIFALMKIVLKIPHFTTVAGRAKSLGKHFKRLSKVCPTDLVFDSSGFKIYGEGEWKVRQHGKQKRRRWKKFHIGVCPKTHEIVVAEVTELEMADCEVGPKLLKKAPRSVKRAIGDGAYDTWNCYKAAHEKGQILIVPPREGAAFNEGEEAWQEARNNAINQIIGFGNDEEAIKLWKKLVRYHE